jgi:hypothetical protein
MMLNIWVETALILIAWLIGYFTTRLLGSGLSCIEVYSLIVGWWLSAYIVAKLQVSIRPVFPLAGIYLVVFLFAWLLKFEWFYKDIGGLEIPHVFLIGILQAVVFSSPVVFDWVVGLAISKSLL